MKTLTIELPDELSAQQEHELKMELAGLVYTRGLVSAHEAAIMVGINRTEFLTTLGQYKISLLDEASLAQLPTEVANARRHLRH